MFRRDFTVPIAARIAAPITAPSLLLAAALFIAGCQSDTLPPVANAINAINATRGGAVPVIVDSPVVFKFATVGDSRQEPGVAGNSAQDERWLQSTPVLARMLNEIESHHPQALVFNGDMVYGYRKDLPALDREYAFWRGMVAGMMERGTYVVPVPGNHEVQWTMPRTDGSMAKTAVVEKELAWRANMGDLIIDVPRWNKLTGIPLTAWRIDNAPAPGTDSITTDQRQLSYSFDVGKIHFAIVNTDPVGADSSAPAEWLKRDMAEARQRGATHFFVFGHKPAFTYSPIGRTKEKPDGFDVSPATRDAFWDTIEAYGATYFCGHQHVFHAMQPRGKAWQVIVGSGGSPFSVKPGQSSNANDRMYAWAEVSVHRDGRVLMQVWGFDEKLGVTRLIESRLI